MSESLLIDRSPVVGCGVLRIVGYLYYFEEAHPAKFGEFQRVGMEHVQPWPRVRIVEFDDTALYLTLQHRIDILVCRKKRRAVVARSVVPWSQEASCRGRNSRSRGSCLVKKHDEMDMLEKPEWENNSSPPSE